ncbi:MAG: TIGR02452 family protein [Bacteroidia bacterium]
MKKTTRIGTAKETLEIIKKGYYITKDDQQIEVRDEQNQAEKGTILYSPQTLTKLIEEQILTAPYLTQYEVINQTTLNAVRAVLARGETEVCALNFASAKNPGGGFLGGAQAQEESIARATGLYPCLIKAWDYYELHRATKTMLYTDTMIYSPKVPIFKDEEGENLPELYTVSIITSAAVNAGVILRQEKRSIPEIEPTMRRRIEKVLALAAHHRQKVLVLGAWGCGVFQNEPSLIAALFAEHLLGKYKNVFEKVVFAIKSDKATFLSPFESHFL